MALYMVSAEFAGRQNSLMHYRVGGEKKGVRRWQNEDGSLTSAGYQHYKDMYGWGDRKAKKAEKYETRATNGRKSEKEMRYWREQTEKAGKAGGEAHQTYSKLEQQFKKSAEKNEQKLQKMIDKELNKAHEKAEEAQRKANERVDNNPFVEGSGAEAKLVNTVKNVENFDKLDAAKKRETGDALLKTLQLYEDTYANSDRKPDDVDMDVKPYADHVYNKLNWWLVQKIDSVSGNENTGEFVQGSNGEKSHKRLMDAYDRENERLEEIEKEIGYDRKSRNSNPKKAQKEYSRLMAALKTDAIWQALHNNSQKSEQALLSAVLNDLGFSNTPENRKAIEAIVFRD